jgi:hypothetical protein
VINGLVAIASKDFFKVKTSRFSRRVGDQMKLELPKMTSNFVKNSIFYIGAKIYNELNQETRNAKTLNSFLNNAIKDIKEMYIFNFLIMLTLLIYVFIYFLAIYFKFISYGLSLKLVLYQFGFFFISNQFLFSSLKNFSFLFSF